MNSRYPSDWRASLFGDVAKITCGVASTPEYVSQDEGVPFFSARNVQNEKLDLAKIQYISQELHKKLTKNTKPERGDILLTRVGAGRGEAAVVNIDFEFSVYVSLTLIKCSPALNSEFVKYLLNSSYYRYLANREQFAGGGVQNLNVQMVKEYTIPLPPLPEQRKIALILSTWDKAITTTERLLANKQQQKKALMQRLLTGKQRFAGFEGEWQYFTLAEVAQITMGSSPLSNAYNETGDGLPLIQGNADIKNRLSAPRIHTSQITKECFTDDVLLSVRAPVGTVAKSLHHACIGRGIAAIRAKCLLSQEYLYQLLLDFEPKWERLSQGSTFESVNSDDIKSLSVCLPCIKEQHQIAKVLSNADTAIAVILNQLDNLKQQKKALMQQLLTGKRRVTVDELAAAVN